MVEFTYRDSTYKTVPSLVRGHCNPGHMATLSFTLEPEAGRGEHQVIYTYD